MGKGKRDLGAGLFIALMLGSAVFGQQPATATLSGRVVDPQGAVILGASVTATHKATASVRETKTNDEGLFVLSSLPPGEYELKVQQQGFKNLQYKSVEVLVGQNTTLDVGLEVGQVTESVLL